MERFWKAALSVAGLAAVAFLVFYALYEQWLQLKIFSQLSQDQTFWIMLVFLGLTFLALVVGVVAWAARGKNTESEETALHRLEGAWKGVNYIDCDKLIGPDVNAAANALEMTSVYWRNGFITRKLLLDKHGQNFCDLFEQIDSCNKAVPGYEKLKKSCRDFLPAPVRATYSEMKALRN